MGLWDKIKKVFKPKPSVPDRGKKLITPKEESKGSKGTVVKQTGKKASDYTTRPSKHGTALKGGGGGRSSRRSGSSRGGGGGGSSSPTKTSQAEFDKALKDRVEGKTEPKPEKTTAKKIREGGYFVDPATNLGYSYTDSAPEDYVRTATMQDIKTGQTAKDKDSGLIFGREGIKDYNKEVERLKRVTPQEKYLDPQTGETFEKEQEVSFGDLKVKTTPMKVYVDPQTGEPIEDLQKYAEENRIPLTESKRRFKISSPQDFLDKISEPKTYDLLGLQTIDKPTIIKKEGQEILYGAGEKYGGGVVPITPLDVTLAITGGKAVASGIGFVSKAGLSAIGIDTAMDIADVAGYYSGANVRIREGLLSAGQSVKSFSRTLPSGLGREQAYGLGFGLGVAGELPAQSQTELAVQLALIGGYGASSRVVKGVTKAGLFGAGAYQIYSGETPEQKALGFLAIGAVTPDIYKGFKKTSYRLSKDYVKTKPDVTGIEFADVDFGKVSYEIKDSLSGVKTIETQPVRVEFIPKRDVSFTGKIDPLKSLSQDIAFKDDFSLPKTTKQQKLILDLTKEDGQIVSGSFAQQALIKDARPFKDLDILSEDPAKFASKLTERYGDIFEVKQKRITDSPLGEFDIYKVYEKKSGKQIADIDPITFGEEGFARYFEPATVEGLKLLPPEVRLTSKILQQTRPLPTDKRLKVATDIAQIKGQPDLSTSPSLLRGYGLSKQQQKLAFLEGDFFATHGGTDLLGKGDIIRLGGVDVGSPKLFYYTPSKYESGIAFARKSRMGFDATTKTATIKDLLSGERLTFFGKKKQVLIETGRLGDEFIQPNIGTSEIEIARVLPKEGTELKIKKRIKTIISGEPVDIAFAEKTSKILPDYSQKEIDKLIKTIDISRRAEYKKVEIRPRQRFTEDLIKEDLIDQRKDKQLRRQLQQTDLRFTPIRDTRTEIIRTPRPRKVIRDTNIPRIIRPDIRTPEIVRRPSRKPRRPIRTRVPTRRAPPRIPIRLTDIDIPPRPRIYTRKKKKRKKIKQEDEFEVLLKRYGKFREIGTGLTKSKALRMGEEQTRKTLARTFKIRKTGKKRDVFQDLNLGLTEPQEFREFKIKRGKKIATPKTFIQRTPALLQTREEKRAIQQARKNAKELNKIINI